MFSLLDVTLSRKASGQASKLPPSGKGNTTRVPGGLPIKDSPANIVAFQHARPFQDIPGPTALYQSVPFASTRLLYYPFSNEKLDDMGTMLSRLQASFGLIMRVRLGAHWYVFLEDLPDIEHAISAYAKETEGQAPKQNHLPLTSRTLGPLDKLTKNVKDPTLAWLDAGTRPQKLRNSVGKYVNEESKSTEFMVCQENMARDLIRLMESCLHSPTQIHTLYQRYALECSGQLCFNQRLGLLGDHYESDGQRQRLVESYRTVIRSLGEINTGTKIFYQFLKGPFGKRFLETRDFVQTWERRQMRQMTVKALRETGGVEPKGAGTGTGTGKEADSLLITLMDDATLTDNDITLILHCLMTTFSEITASALTMLLASLATNVDKQEKLATELATQLTPDGQLKDNMPLYKLYYLGACINESLRVNFPISSGGQIVLRNNIVLNNYLVPAGTPIVVNSRRTAKNPVWFDHPNFYVPERWTDEDKVHNMPPTAFMPFGFWDHGCMGLRGLFFQQVSAAVIKIVLKYKIDLPEEYHSGQLKTGYIPFCSPTEPLPFIFTPRITPPRPADK